MNKYILIFLLFATPCFAGDFVCGEGTSISKRISCGRTCSENINCLRVTRETSVVNKKLIDGKLLDLTKEELDAIEADKALSRAEADKYMTIEKLVSVLEEKEILTKTEVESKEIINVSEISR